MKPRPVLRYHGGKWMLAPWIIQYLPPHRVYVEPFGGAGSVLIRKPRSHAEVWNDLDGEVFNLFEVLRGEHAHDLVQKLRLTPFHRSEFVAARKTSPCPIERARRLVCRSFMGFGSNSCTRVTGFRSNSNRSGNIPAADWANYPDALVQTIERLRGVVFENRDARLVMSQHDSNQTLHFLDPPYMKSTRGRGSDYAYEMTDCDHADLLAFCQTLKGAVVICGYPSPLYDEALSGWVRIERAALACGARKRTEVLWIKTP